MNTREVILATGICQGSVYDALHNGDLCGEKQGRRWSITPAEAFRWACDCHLSGRYLMFEPRRIAAFIREFHLQ